MKRLYILLVSVITVALITSSCDRYYNPGLNVRLVQEDTTAVNESQTLLDFLTVSGEYINTRGIPNLISAEDVNENLSSYLVIDLRSQAAYENGHVNGALNVKFSNLLDYMEKNVSASNYEKVIITCNSGQIASYATGLLRLIGYNNVYGMKYGMNSWSKDITDYWTQKSTNKYANQLETVENPKGQKFELPTINTGKKVGSEILYQRVKQVFKDGFKPYKVKADDLFANTSGYYIVNYWPEDKYLKGHIPGAVQFTPKKSLGKDQKLNFLPTNKKILVYCFTGQSAAFVIAYLRTLGYDAYTLSFGANSFMHDVLLSRSNWHGFKASEKINDFSLVFGKEPSDKKTVVAIPTAGDKPKTKKKVVKRKKKEVEGGCG